MSKKTLRQRVTTYFRQLSFIAEPRVTNNNGNAGGPDRGADFIRKYLNGQIPDRCPPAVYSGRDAETMPDIQVRFGEQGNTTQRVVVACTGPGKGIASVQRSKLHLSASDIDFIDMDNNNLEESDFEVRRSKRANVPRFGGINQGSGQSRLKQNVVPVPVAADEEKNSSKISLNTSSQKSDAVELIADWTDDDYACGLTTSLYERNPISQEVTGSPIADCYVLVSRGDSCVLALADGVNWGEKASLAARAALRGAVEYLNTALLGVGGSTASNRPQAMTTREVCVSLLRSMWEGHNCILEVGGALTTLTVAVVIPLADAAATESNERQEGQAKKKRWMVCAVNVGDSLGFVYSPRTGVREFTEASHDTNSNRDMRDALGALGPVDGTKPELGNLTLSMTEVEEDDIVFLTSDGVSDNFDPVVGKFALAAADTPDLGSVKTRLQVNVPHQGQTVSRGGGIATKSTTGRPKLQQQVSLSGKSTGLGTVPTPRPQYNRSRTVIEPRRSIGPSVTLLPQLTPEQRHKLMLLRIEDLLSFGINGTTSQACRSSRQLVELLIDFSKMITSARRSMLEQRESYVRLVMDPVTGQRREAELNRLQQRAARKKIVDSASFQSLPGKLDHASVVAFTCRTQRTEEINSSSTTVAVHPSGDRGSKLIETDL